MKEWIAALLRRKEAETAGPFDCMRWPGMHVSRLSREALADEIEREPGQPDREAGG